MVLTQCKSSLSKLDIFIERLIQFKLSCDFGDLLGVFFEEIIIIFVVLLKINFKLFSEFSIDPILNGLDLAYQEVCFLLLFDSSHVNDTSLTAFSHSLFINSNDNLPQFFYCMLESFCGSNLNFGLR